MEPGDALSLEHSEAGSRSGGQAERGSLGWVGLPSLCLWLRPRGGNGVERGGGQKCRKSLEGGAEWVGLIPYPRDRLGLFFRAGTRVRRVRNSPGVQKCL